MNPFGLFSNQSKRRKTKFKPAALCLKIYFVSHPVEGLGKYTNTTNKYTSNNLFIENSISKPDTFFFLMEPYTIKTLLGIIYCHILQHYYYFVLV